MKTISIPVFGSCCTKEALLSQFVGGYLLDMRGYGASSHSYIDGCRKECVIDGEQYMLAFEDGYLNSEYPLLVEHQERTSQGFLLLYDADWRQSFQNVESHVEKLSELINGKVLPRPDRTYREGDNTTSGTAAGGTGTVIQNLQARLRTVSARVSHRDQRGSKQPASERSTDTFTCFPRLPGELQLAILRACLISPQPIRNRRPANNGININVLAVCRFFHEEGTKIYWAENQFESGRPIYLVADSTWPVPGRHQIDAAEGRALADRFGCQFFEHSSQSHEQVEALIMGMARECIAQSVDVPTSSRTVPTPSAVPVRQGRFRSTTRSWTQRVSRAFNS